MTTTCFQRTDCRLCGSTDLESVLELTPTPVGGNYVPEDELNQPDDVYPLRLSLCHSCGYAGLIDVVDPDILFRDSDEATSISLGMNEHHKVLAQHIVTSFDPPKGSLVVDIGSNDGTYLKCFQELGLRALGIEPSIPIAQRANDEGVETLQAFLNVDLAAKIAKDYGHASVVTANRVFANIDDLVEVVQAIKALLSPDGVFVFETGYLLDVVEDSLLDTIYHEHLGYFGVKPLSAFFGRNGLELLNVERTTVKGGSIRGMVQLAGGPRKVQPAVAELIALEESHGLESSAPYQKMIQQIDLEKAELTELIKGLKSEGKSIAGYGSSVGCVTLIYHFGLGDVLDFLVDDDPRYHGLFSPGHHIPAHSPQALYDNNPDYVIVVAWRMAEPIIGNHKKYLNQGGKFIVLYPELKIVTS